MPCDSSVTNTKILDATRLSEALAALGATDVNTTEMDVSARLRGGERVRFWRYGKTDAFQTDLRDRDTLNEIQRKNTEIGIRTLAKRKGWLTSTEENGTKFTLTNRKGGK